MTTSLPQQYRKVICTKLSTDFRDGTKIISVPLKLPSDNEVIVQIYYVGINASDINYTAGKYIPGVVPPFDTGFEGVGRVVAVGSAVTKFAVGDNVIVLVFGVFGEYITVQEKLLIKAPIMSPELIALMVSGLTASVSLEVVGEVGRVKGETVLVTAAAGATGTFAVQIAKLAGCHIVGTCGSEDKVKFLKSLGIDRAINYKKENLFEVLKKEYPGGINLVYESVGGDTFNTCVNNLARRGRIIVIGALSGYKDGSAWSSNNQKQSTPLPSKLLQKSATIHGFFLNHFIPYWGDHIQKLIKLTAEKKLKPVIDDHLFQGLESIPDAVEYLYDGKNTGKIVVHVKPKSAL
eukprot:TRINITY_DN1762_c0_g2_i1.p1 TRINITY_DN1762_c0_g2~~TRINITY_DN1762_c0_g2_i1.p1  ORF type:complete len:349 (+),score=61.42 TRINITY_DN1762_c0_g2_i1:52-1098(+)